MSEDGTWTWSKKAGVCDRGKKKNQQSSAMNTFFLRRTIFRAKPYLSPSRSPLRRLSSLDRSLPSPSPSQLCEICESSSKQITAVARANTQVVSTPVARPSLSDRPQPATTNTNVRSRARRPTVEISLRLFCGFHA